MAHAADDFGCVVDQVIGSICEPAVVEELDAYVPVQGQDPVADLVDLMQEAAVLGVQS